jgi:saccharopine dehydrogenase (NAD+, L-lysine forming)
MGRVMIIGAGGVGSVVAHKCAQVPEVFEDILLASRTVSKCARIRKDLLDRYDAEIKIAQVDADDPDQVAKLIRNFRPDIVVNVALPYQDLSIMDACLEEHAHYLDTANYEPPDEAHFEYSWQWKKQDQFKEEGIMAVLGCGFDPGVTNVFTAYAQKHLFDEIHYLDILDCNAGNHGKAFATNFDPEINIREVTQDVRYWRRGKTKEGRWIYTPPIIEPGSVHFPFDYPEIGPRESYMLNHEELESLVRHIPKLRRARFWMTFSQEYLTHLRVLQNVGMTRIDEVDFHGQRIAPIKFLKALLPDPTSLAEGYTGKTAIGNVMTGKKGGKEITKYIYNVCDHEETYREVGSQAIAYTTGVPAMIGAMMVIKGEWAGNGVYNVEQLNPDPFMQKLTEYGLPWHVVNSKKLPDEF